MQAETGLFGPSIQAGRLMLSIWAPERDSVEILFDHGRIQAEPVNLGFWQATLEKGNLESEYSILLDGEGPYPDPASRFMPNGISGRSLLHLPEGYKWKNKSWKGVPLQDYAIEEIHVGTFTNQGTYSAVEEKLDHLQDIGITAVELMPVAEFYGTRNWGYDGVYLYSPHYTYGKPEDLMHLVDALHSRGISAILDVVYNHGGPVGNYLERFGPFYSSIHRNPWGACFNFDGEHSSAVREFVIQNALYWLGTYRFDALRLDAVHGIHDSSNEHIMKEMSRRVHDLADRTGRNIYLIAESDRNDRYLTSSIENCGYGIDAQWNDDFHHVLHYTMTGETLGYYSDYAMGDGIYRSLETGFVYQGEYSGFLKKFRGTRWGQGPKNKLVAFSQNHDQVGNRAWGERLISIAGPRKARESAAITILSPFTPLIFMGEEMGETAPFLFFIDTHDSAMARTVYEGRKKEFSGFKWKDFPDPNDERTFQSSKLKWKVSEMSRSFNSLYRDLLKIRKEYVLPNIDEFRPNIRKPDVVEMKYGKELTVYASFLNRDTKLSPEMDEYEVILSTEWKKYGGKEPEAEGKSNSLTVGRNSAVVCLTG